MKFRIFTALLFVVGCSVIGILDGCGGTTKTVTSPKPLIYAVAADKVVPVGDIKLAPETARHPDGYSPQAPPPENPFERRAVPRLSPHGAHVIEEFEGFASCPYWDVYGGVWTRGYGETEGIHSYSPCISLSYAERNLIYRAERFYGWAIASMERDGARFNQNQIDALYSFAWNLGAGIFTGSLRYAVEHHNPYPLLAYDRAGGVVLSGLVRRRHAEVALFLTPVHEETPAQRRARIHRERTNKLHADYRQRRALNAALIKFHCLNGYARFSKDHQRKCNSWRSRHAAINRDIKKLHREGIK